MAVMDEKRSATPVKTADGTVGKALDVLDQVAGFGRPVRFAELLEGSRYPKATLYRFVQTLTNQNMLSYDPERQTYSPGFRLVRLAHAAWRQTSLAPIARPYLDQLSLDIGETVHLAQLDSGHVLYVDKRNARQPIAMYSQAGKIGPAYCTGVGKAMLAYLREPQLSTVLSQQSFHVFTPHTLRDIDSLKAELVEIRTAGHAFDREEHEPTIICVAVPIITNQDNVLGALSVTSSTQRSSLEALELLAPRLKRTAKTIAEEATNWHFPDA
ncbi:IclR family transcriptional regulator [Cohaesibacter sp. CAU 1516]|uniref:IclR family transcriptional regulator n=1 Tax=Cohaesibacter sp. CAU 1516 TaxID=2576038 RepID=UPI001AED6292|nr:IclR family transcriptional regulator [Cohaesibacter sp. CAU 1516]